MVDISISEALNFLQENDNFTVVCHGGPDGDALGSASALVLALREKGKRAWAFCPSAVPENLEFFYHKNIFEEEFRSEGRCLVSVDVSSNGMLGICEEFFDNTPLELSIDHHEINSINCKRRLLFPHYIANGEIIYELLREGNYPLTKEIAFHLYSAICADSGGFRYKETRPETMVYVSELMKTGIDFVSIYRNLFEKATWRSIEVEKRAFASLESYYEGKVACVTLEREDLAAGEPNYDIVNVMDIPRKIGGVEVSFVVRPENFRDLENRNFKVSLRSNNYFNVASFAALFGGGGHFHAAGCKIKGDSSAEVAKIIVEALKDKI